MLKTVLDYFNAHLMPVSEASAEDLEARSRLAVVVLLVEIAEADFEQAPEEKSAILQVIKQQFNLDSQQALTLIELAQQEHGQSTDYFQFTSLINQNYTQAAKIQIVEALWRIAFADQQLHHYEEHVIRRLSDLLHVSHKDFIAAKHRVMADHN